MSQDEWNEEDEANEEIWPAPDEELDEEEELDDEPAAPAESEAVVSAPEAGHAMPSNKRKYPFPNMGLGDSFEVKLRGDFPDKASRDAALKSMRSSLSSSAATYGRRHNIKLVVRKTGPSALRCWRVE